MPLHLSLPLIIIHQLISISVSMEIVSVQQMRELESLSEKSGITPEALINNAAKQIAKNLICQIGKSKKTLLFLIGPGNNGYDGLLATQYLKKMTFEKTKIYTYACTDPHLLNYDISEWKEYPFSHSVLKDTNLSNLTKLIQTSDIVVDAILGIGISRPIKNPIKKILIELNKEKRARASLKIIAVDTPTGLDSNTGTVDENCPFADITLSLGNPKIGLFELPGINHIGKHSVLDIGIPKTLQVNSHIKMLTSKKIIPYLPHRNSISHKGSSGRVLIIGGSKNFIGAAYFAAAAAYRVGAGLVTIATPQSLVTPLSIKIPEATFIPLRESSPGVVSSNNLDLIIPELSKYNALVVGCGIGQDSQTQIFLSGLLTDINSLPQLVIDADALNWISSMPEKKRLDLIKKLNNPILTPHHGEMKRLVDISIESNLPPRIPLIHKLSQAWNATFVLKGPYTLVGTKDGSIYINPAATPSLATAGTGDILAGMIGGLIAQNLSNTASSITSVFIHGLAGLKLTETIGEIGSITSDLLNILPSTVQELRKHL